MGKSRNRVELRKLGKSNKSIPVVGLGTWQLGADWGEVTESDALNVLDAAYESGVRFFDTADAYGDGRSEQLISTFLISRKIDDVVVGTKVGRRVMPQSPEIYNLENLRNWIDRSRKNLKIDTLDLVQLHCPPSSVYQDGKLFEILDSFIDDGRIFAYGFSVETRAEALAAISRPNVASVQIVFNMLRQAPLSDVLPAALAADVSIIARVPLASGLLSGKYDEKTTFPENDHRNYNREGKAFDIGETFAGVDFNIGLEAVRRISHLIPDGVTMAEFALRWIIDQAGMTTVIPGARNGEQAKANALAAEIAPLSSEMKSAIKEIYNELIAPQIGGKW